MEIHGLYPSHVSSESHSSPKTHRRADNFPFNMPHSKSSQGPTFSIPHFSSTFFAELTRPFPNLGLDAIRSRLVTDLNFPGLDLFFPDLVAVVPNLVDQYADLFNDLVRGPGLLGVLFVLQVIDYAAVNRHNGVFQRGEIPDLPLCEDADEVRVGLPVVAFRLAEVVLVMGYEAELLAGCRFALDDIGEGFDKDGIGSAVLLPEGRLLLQSPFDARSLAASVTVMVSAL